MKGSRESKEQEIIRLCTVGGYTVDQCAQKLACSHDYPRLVMAVEARRASAKVPGLKFGVGRTINSAGLSDDRADKIAARAVAEEWTQPDADRFRSAISKIKSEAGKDELMNAIESGEVKIKRTRESATPRQHMWGERINGDHAERVTVAENLVLALEAHVGIEGVRFILKSKGLKVYGDYDDLTLTYEEWQAVVARVDKAFVAGMVENARQGAWWEGWRAGYGIALGLVTE